MQDVKEFAAFFCRFAPVKDAISNSFFSLSSFWSAAALSSLRETESEAGKKQMEEILHDVDPRPFGVPPLDACRFSYSSRRSPRTPCWSWPSGTCRSDGQNRRASTTTVEQLFVSISPFTASFSFPMKRVRHQLAFYAN